MPWNAKDATKHTKAAKSAHLKRQWAAAANASLKAGKSEGAAIRIANAAVAKSKA